MQTSGGEKSAFANQLFLPQQRALYEHWVHLAGADPLPSRASFHPAQVPDLLPHLSLLELRPPPHAFHVRLAGSALPRWHGCDITGTTLQCAPWESSREYWRHIIATMAAERRPMAGVWNDAKNEARVHLVLFWLRLPLLGDDGGLILLGLDMILNTSEAARHAPHHAGALPCAG
ncbi:MAG TPA: PAS domain-containing protein [Thermopetrobacter sp.]|nr:PAS domain-containing protein [Thermopetrobacter sp.]